MPFIKKTAHSDDREDALRILNENTPFAIKEAFNSLYTNILYLPIEDKCKKISITSSCSGEGKTYISVNLALSLAENTENKKVLLIDMDMRKPRVARLLNALCDKDASKMGTSEYLAGITEEPNFIKTNRSNLYVLLSGAESPNPGGLISSSKMKDLIDICDREFDYVIIDTPPVGIVSDALLLVSLINGYFIATRADYSDVHSLADTIESIKRVDGQILGIILSSTNPKRSQKNYRYKNYSKDYSNK